MPAHEWTRDATDRYVAPFPPNLARNGKVASLTDWRTWSNDGSFTTTLDTVNCAPGQTPCIAFRGGKATTGGQVSSSVFNLEAGQSYKVTLSYKVPLGKKLRVLVRRNDSPWDSAGLIRDLPGTGTWTTTNLPFQAALTMPNARLDLESNGVTDVLLDNMAVSPVMTAPLGIQLGGTPLVLAHHPHAGYDAQSPTSLYLPISRNAAVVPSATAGVDGSMELPLSTHVSAPNAGNMLTPGTSVYIRTAPWTLERKTIKSISNGVARLDSVTQRPIRANFGYFFAGALWMLDKPGEWVFNTGNSSIYMKPSAGRSMNDKVQVIHLARGLDLSGINHVEISGLTIRRTGIGVDATKASSIRLSGNLIEETAQQGIFAPNSISITISGNRIQRTGLDAVVGVSSGYLPAQNMIVNNNEIQESGVRMSGDTVISLPVASGGAIMSGKSAQVLNNVIRNTSYNGIYTLSGSVVRSNLIENTCQVLDDCGGIYTYGQNNHSRFEQNIIRNLRGNLNGVISEVPHTVGIYLDELSSGVTVSRNTVENAQHGIQLHNAASNAIDSNTLYANRSSQLFLQEGTRIADPLGDVSQNVVTNNRYVPLGTAIGVVQETSFESTIRFARHDHNLHSTLLSPVVSRERNVSKGLTYGFLEWRAATASGMPRNLDPNGKEIKQGGFTSFLVSGASVVPPLSTGSSMTDGWEAWNESTSKASYKVETCGATTCMHLVPGGAPSLLATPRFATTQGQWYRMTFDMKTKVTQQRIGISFRRAGGRTEDYSMLAPAHFVYGSTSWRRYTVQFQSNGSVSADYALTGQRGARIDFQNVQPGQDIMVANVELVPLTQVGSSLQTALLSNPSPLSTKVNCPADAVAAGTCSQFVAFDSGLPISWPRSLPAFGSEVVYTRNASVSDNDEDSIADTQDQCPGTPDGTATNSKGCAMPFIQ